MRKSPDKGCPRHIMGCLVGSPHTTLEQRASYFTDLFVIAASKCNSSNPKTIVYICMLLVYKLMFSVTEKNRTGNILSLTGQKT